VAIQVLIFDPRLLYVLSDDVSSVRGAFKLYFSLSSLNIYYELLFRET
jgi:hypothetical protein